MRQKVSRAPACAAKSKTGLGLCTAKSKASIALSTTWICQSRAAVSGTLGPSPRLAEMGGDMVTNYFVWVFVISDNFGNLHCGAGPLFEKWATLYTTEGTLFPVMQEIDSLFFGKNDKI